MKNLRKICGAWLLVFALLINLMPTAFAADAYTVGVTASKTEGLKVGDTVTLTATVTADGTEITDLGSGGLELWFWADTWATGHSDGQTALTLSDNTGAVLSTDITFNAAGTYYIAAEVKESNTRKAIEYLTFSVAAADQPDPTEITLPNGDFESGTDGWTLTGYNETQAGGGGGSNSSFNLKLWLSDDNAVSGSAAYTVELTAGTYYFTFDLTGAASDSGLNYTVSDESRQLATSSSTYTTTGWGQWETYQTDSFTLTGESAVTFTLSGTQPAGWWGWLDNLKLYGTGSIVGGEEPDPDPTPAPDPVEAGIYIPYVAGSEDDFIRGADVSSLLSILNSGARFKNWDGTTLGDTVDSQGTAFMRLLKDAGVNWVRLRVWNDPYNSSKQGYGGGNNDLDAAKTIGKWATDAGLKVLIDFHYSDFWADPSKQKAPKAWDGKTVDEKAALITEFTTSSLNTLLNAGVDVGMVQVGNETTNGICGVWYSSDGWPAACKLYSAGCNAVHAVATSKGKQILAAIHFTNPERSDNYANFAKQLNDNNVNYDVFASSYYPFWHGTTENLTTVLKQVADTYGKKVMVAETSWAWTLDEGDGHDNTVRTGTNDTAYYPFSVQGQATEVASVIAAVTAIGEKGIGAFYWEPAWIPVNNVFGLTGDDYTSAVNNNKALWEEYGSGWASSYAGEYDPDDAGRWFGGSAIDNQAMFDFDGKPLESLNVFKYVTTGTTGYPVLVESVETFTQTYNLNDTLALPQTAVVTTNMGDTANLPITWANIGDVDMANAGVYTVNGTVSGTVGGLTVSNEPTSCVVTVLRENKLPNPGFEEGNTSYTLTGWHGDGIQAKNDVHNGNWCLHYYYGTAFSASAEHAAVQLPAGTYEFAIYIQGADTTGRIYVKDASGNELGTANYTVAGWKEWQNPVVQFTLSENTYITVGLEINCSAGAWGTTDDWGIYETDSTPAESWTISYNANGGSGSMADSTVLNGEELTLPGCGFTPPDGKVFDTWAIGSVNGHQVPAGGSYTFTANTTVYAVWKDLPPLSYDITGIVLQNSEGVAGATVKLTQGMNTIAQQTTSTDGSFSFSNVLAGIYNLIVEKDGITMTVMQEIPSSANLTITLPNGKTNTVVEIKDDGTPPVVVGGMENLFNDKNIYTDEDEKVVTDGGTVEFKMEVEKQDAPSASSQIEAIKPSDQTVGLYLDLSITKTVTPKDGGPTISAVTEVSSLLETLISLPVEMQGKDGYAVYRVHDGVAEALPNGGASERYEVNTDKTTITIFAQKYSTYAIAWSDGGETPVEPPQPPVTPVVPVVPSAPSSGTNVKMYAITIEKAEHGTVTSNRINAASGTTITLTVTPDAGYVLLDLAVTDSQGNTINVTERNTFTMPARDVTVTAVFAPLPEDVEQPCDGGADCPSRRFSDLDTVGTWYHEAVDYALRNGLMNGYENNLFGPDNNLSRAMLVQVLYNKEGKPVVNYLMQFADVSGDKWYAEAVRWAASMGIVTGYGNGLFGPDDKITREQLAVMLWRYAGSPAATHKELNFSDADEASSYALEALRWAVENGIIDGVGNGLLNPGGLATRAQVAQMLKNYLDQ